jgi:hypothetical protein
MKRIFILTTMFLMLGPGLAGLVAADSTGKNHDKKDTAHGDMDMSTPKGNFQHTMTEKQVRADFQIMSLADMNLKDQDGNTHHVMVKLFDASKKDPLKAAIGKVKIIGPDKSEQSATLTSYNGIFAANFKFKQTGKYGVICLLKVNGETHLFKFWYPYG